MSVFEQSTQAGWVVAKEGQPGPESRCVRISRRIGRTPINIGVGWCWMVLVDVVFGVQLGPDSFEACV